MNVNYGCRPFSLSVCRLSSNWFVFPQKEKFWHIIYPWWSSSLMDGIDDDEFIHNEVHQTNLGDKVIGPIVHATHKAPDDSIAYCWARDHIIPLSMDSIIAGFCRLTLLWLKSYFSFLNCELDQICPMVPSSLRFLLWRNKCVVTFKKKEINT